MKIKFYYTLFDKFLCDLLIEIYTDIDIHCFNKDKFIFEIII